MSGKRCRAQAFLELGDMNVLKGDQRQARVYYQQCEKVVVQHELKDYLAPLRKGTANNLYRLGDLPAALEACDEWLSTFTDDKYNQLRADVLRIKGYVLLWNFRLSEAEANFCHGEALAKDIGDRYLEAYFLNNRAEFPWPDQLKQQEPTELVDIPDS